MNSRNTYYQYGPGGDLGALIGAGELNNKGGWCTARRLDDYALVYVIGGGGWFIHGDEPRQAVHAGDVLVLFPGIVHSYGPDDGEPWDECWLMFRGTWFDAFRAHHGIDPQRPLLHVGLSPSLLSAWQALIDAREAAAARLRSPAVAQVEEAELAAQTLLLLTRLQLAAQATDAATPAWVAIAGARLAADLHLPADLRRIAGLCGLSYERFRKAFAEVTGLSPARYRLLRRIDRAKALLTAGEEISRTAELLGFCDVYFFTRQFRAVTGTTPARFRGSAVQRR